MEAQFRCPSCGSLLHVRDVSAPAETVGAFSAPDSAWQSHTMRTIRSGEAASHLSQVHEKFTPTREPTVAGDVRVPLAQAAITAVVIAALITMVTTPQHGTDWIPTAVITFSAILTVSWLWLLVDHRSLLRTVERITNKDINRDGRVADRPVEIERRVALNSVEFSATGRYLRSRRIEIPRGDEHAVVEMARGVIAGKAYTQRQWAHLYNREEFNALRDKLITNGYAIWRDLDDHNLGVEILATGRALFRALAEPTPPPHSTDTA